MARRASKRTAYLYVFRLSDGKLISERLGLAPDDWQYSDELGASAQTSRFFYHTYMRGYYGDLFRRIKGTYVNELNFGDWQAKSGINPELHQRQADHLKPGDRVELIAINRATGYMGSVQTTMQAAGSDAGLGRDLSWDIAPIKLQPPNLKIWVDRKYNINEGLRKGTIIKDQIIGYEGAALSSDNLIALSTEWLKPDGTDFPVSTDTASSDYGYTGRVAFLSGDNQIVSGSNVGVAQFPIKPGKHLQIIQLPNGANSNQHFYIQVSGEPATGKPIFGSAAKSANFDSTGVHDGKLKARPDRFVPFMVPVFDEKTTEAQRQTYRQLKEENPGQSFEKPAPIYQWVYRPEFQYSLYDLSIDKINRYEKDATDGEDILKATQPIITSSDDLIEILYNLDISKYTPVDYFNTGEEKELIFAIGEQELRAKINEKDKLEFANLEHLASLDAEDFLTIRLYTNKDVGNVLWEYAFGHISLFPGRNSSLSDTYNTIEITADAAAESPVSVNAFLQKGGDNPLYEHLLWDVKGSGTVTPSSTTSTTGSYSTALYLPTVADTTSTVFGRLGSSPNKFYSTTYKILPGVASTINVDSKTGKTVIGGLGEVSWTISVKDAFGNKVQDGTKFLVLASELDISGDKEIINGKATIKFTGNSIAGNNQVIIAVGNASIQETVEVHDVELSFPDLHNVQLNKSVNFTLQATSSYGNLEGLALDVAVHRGEIANPQVILDSSSKTTIPYSSGQYRGFAQLSAKVSGTKRVLSQDFNVVGQGAYLTNNVLVTNGAGSIDLGNGASLDYSSTTDLNIPADPFEDVTSTLVNIFEPPLYALQDFNTDLGQNTEGSVFDISSGIDGVSNNVSMAGSSLKKFNLSWQFNKVASEESFIEIPEHERTSNLSQAGVNFWIKIPDMSNMTSASTLVDWDDYGLQIKLNPDKSLSLIAMQESAHQEIKHPSPIKPGNWHQIAAHLYKGKLRFGVDDEVISADLANPLVAPKSESYAIKIALDNQLNGLNITGLKIFDWQGEAKITYADGTFEQSTTADADGKAKFSLTARPALVAYTRPYEKKTFLAQIGNILVPNAYAGTVKSGCESSYSPIDPNADDATIRMADQYMTMLLECFFKPHVEEAKIAYETSKGFGEAAVALVKRETLEAVYAVLKQQKQNSIVILNCLDAALTGSNSSAVGAACDFITSMLAVGDLRDILLQSWHYHLGHLTGTQDDYDELTAQLSSIGLIASASQLIPGAGQTAGVVATAFVATAKAVAKLLKKVGVAGKTAGRFIAQKLGKIMDNPATDAAQKMDAVKLMAPLLEIGSSLALIYDSEPRLFSFLAHTISSGKALDNIVVWFDRYTKRLEADLIAQNQARFPDWLRFLISEAHAITAKAEGKFVAQLTKLLDGVDIYWPDIPDYTALAPKFNDQLDRFIKLVDDPNYKFPAVANDMDVLRAFITVGELGGSNTVNKFAKHEGYTIGVPKASFDETEFINAFADLPLKNLTPEAQKALAGLINTFDNKIGFPITKGNIAHVLTVADMLKGTKHKVLKIEAIADPLEMLSGTKFAGRRIDIQVEIEVDGVKKIINIEFKNWSSKTWKANLAAAMSKTPKSGGEAAEEAAQEVGQLYTDLLRYMKEGNTGQQWMFTPDVIESGLTKGDMENKIIDKIDELIDDHEGALALEFGIENLDELPIAEKIAWDNRVTKLKEDMRGSGSDGQKFVQIYDFGNISK
ncbi:MAG: hypothetical protein H7A01_18395 [Hahellaceae bacterium]|nr:hypothetical protein [Hahellaceae bacterium]MCP5213059.1 hypothetical protein [Hahellaceae bacterium]